MEYMLRAMAVLTLALLLIGFGWYFSFGTDTLQHDWIFFGGGVLSLLSGLATLGFIPMLLKLKQEFGDDVTSDIGYPELVGPPPARGGAAARAAAAEAESESEDV
ncbi:MAG: hypothetical protein QOK05_2484 [Chloroflexota bacterium]|jgi:hypothetical protein|nr:hypothetical protein [Chloroflexota bacterium]